MSYIFQNEYFIIVFLERKSNQFWVSRAAAFKLKKKKKKIGLHRIVQNRLHMKMSRQVSNIWDSTVSLGSLLQHSVALKVKKNISSSSCGTSYIPVSSHRPLFCHWAKLKRTWPHLLYSCPVGSKSLVIREMLQASNDLCISSLFSFQKSSVFLELNTPIIALPGQSREGREPPSSCWPCSF